MLKWLNELDRILRGEATNLQALRAGRIEVPVGGLTLVIIMLGLITGSCVGSFSVFRPGGPFFLQLLASTLKVPALFLLTLLVTFPSLYVFNALVGSRLMIGELLKLLVASIGVTMAMLAAFGPIVAFFSVSTTSYPFMALLNVLVFGIGSVLGLRFLLQTLHRLSLVSQERVAQERGILLDESRPLEESSDETSKPIGPAGALGKLEGHTLGNQVRIVFRLWVIVFALVGAQMSWVLRPFIGDPNRQFEWFRERQSNFFQAVWYVFLNLFS
jgi:hypothetical protein